MLILMQKNFLISSNIFKVISQKVFKNHYFRLNTAYFTEFGFNSLRNKKNILSEALLH